MPYRPLATACALLATATASAQLPLTSGKPAPAPAPALATNASVPTYWVLMVTGEKDGAPWLKTSTPNTQGGSVKDTGSFRCSYPPTQRGVDEGIGYERMEIACGIGDAEVFVNLHCAFRSRAKTGRQPGQRWQRGELQTLNLREKGDSKSTITVSLRCDVDAAFSIE